MFRNSVVTIILFALALNALGSPKTSFYSVPEVNWEPYWIVQGTAGNGILGKLMQHLSRQPEINLRPHSPLPVKRVQLMFERDAISVECCMNQNWRPREDSAGTSLWSDPVMTTYEVLVFPKGREFKASSTMDLGGRQLATILGYGYANDQLYYRNDVLDNIAQLKLVAFDRVDVGIFDMHELNYLLNTVKEAKEMAGRIVVGSKVGSSELRMRVHSSRPELLNMLNSGLRKAHSDGTFDEILKQYLGP